MRLTRYGICYVDVFHGRVIRAGDLVLGFRRVRVSLAVISAS